MRADESIYSPNILDFRERLKTLSESNSFVKFKPCERCEGTGLSGFFKSRAYGDYSWNGEYCDHCKGNGGSLISLNEILCSVCTECNGVGKITIDETIKGKCNKCNGQGTIDWLTRVLG